MKDANWQGNLEESQGRMIIDMGMWQFSGFAFQCIMIYTLVPVLLHFDSFMKVCNLLCEPLSFQMLHMFYLCYFSITYLIILWYLCITVQSIYTWESCMKWHTFPYPIFHIIFGVQVKLSIMEFSQYTYTPVLERWSNSDRYVFSFLSAHYICSIFFHPCLFLWHRNTLAGPNSSYSILGAGEIFYDRV